MWCVSNIHLRIEYSSGLISCFPSNWGPDRGNIVQNTFFLLRSFFFSLSLLLFFFLQLFETDGRKNFRLIVHESGANFLRRFLDKNLRRIHVLIKRLPLSNRAGVSLDVFKINGMSKLFQESSSFKENNQPGIWLIIFDRCI